MASESKVN